MNETFQLVLLAIMKLGKEENEDSGKGGFREPMIVEKKSKN
jgi:hypothetical protein